MQVRLKCTLDDGKSKTPAGTIVDLDREEALRLVRNKSAARVNVEEVIDGLIPTDESDDLPPESGSGTPDIALAIVEFEKIDGMRDDLIDALYADGKYSIQDVADLEVKDIQEYVDISKKRASTIIKSARKLIAPPDEDDE